jgi:peptidoglycan/LPS O-acetylase OafA/YrhL
MPRFFNRLSLATAAATTAGIAAISTAQDAELVNFKSASKTPFFVAGVLLFSELISSRPKMNLESLVLFMHAVLAQLALPYFSNDAEKATAFCGAMLACICAALAPLIPPHDAEVARPVPRI